MKEPCATAGHVEPRSAPARSRARQITTTQRLLPARAVASEYGIAYTTLRELVHRGELPVLRIGRAWYLERADIDRWIASRKETAAA